MDLTSKEVTGLLRQLSSRNQDAVNQLVPLLYTELRRLASRYLRRERVGHTLQPTALVHEAYLKLVDQDVDWKNRSHFFGVAAQLMRRILVDYARSRQAAKRGGPVPKLSLERAVVEAPARPVDLVGLDEVLNRLAVIDPRQARIVELRFFGGLTLEETAEVLGTSTATVKREFSMAKAWLAREMRKTNSSW